MTHVNPVLDQTDFRFREDSGAEASPTWLALANTNISIELDTDFRIRIVFAETANSTNAATVAPSLFYSLNSGTYTALGTTTPVQFGTLTGTTDGTATTQQVGAGSFVAGEVDDNGTVNTVDLQNSETEYEWCLTLDSGQVSNGDTIDLRVYDNNSPLDNYTVTPRVTGTAPDNLSAADVESNSDLTDPALGQEHALTASDVESASDLTDPSLSEIVDLTASDVESASDLTDPSIGVIHNLTASDVESASDLTDPALTDFATTDDLTAEDVVSLSELTSPSFAERIEIIRPDGDVSVGNWSTDTGATTNLFQSIDEATRNDADYIRSEFAPADSSVELSMGNPTITPTATGPHIVRYAYGKDVNDSQRLDLTVTLLQGGTTIASWSHNDVPFAVAEAEQTLTGGQAAAISDYTDLRWDFNYNAP